MILAQESLPILQQDMVDTGESVVARVYVRSDSAITTDVTLDGKENIDDGVLQGGEWRSLENDPFHLLVLYDASGTMTPAATAMRAQAQALLDLLPEEAQVAIYRFNDRPELEYPFAPKEIERKGLMSAIQNLQVENDATCLYDALAHMLTIVAQIEPNAPRRAVILLSDGRDEKTRGQEDTCSAKSERDILAQAANAEPPIPIFVLGFEGSEPVDEAALHNLAGGDDSNRFAMHNGQAPLANGKSLFDNLMDYFSQQWLLELQLHPDVGEHIIDISGQTAAGQILSLSIPFTAVNDYTPVPPPPEEVPDLLEVALENFVYHPRDNQFEYTIRFSDVTIAQRAGDWQLQITDISSTEFITHTILVEEQITDTSNISPTQIIPPTEPGTQASSTGVTVTDTHTISHTDTITDAVNPQINNIGLDLSGGRDRITGTTPLSVAGHGFMQPAHIYQAEILAPTPSSQDKIEISTPIESAIWQAPEPIVDVKYHITGLRPPTLHITYTTVYEEYADKLIGYVWNESGATSFVPVTTTVTSGSMPLNTIATPGTTQYYTHTTLSGFGTYSLTTYFQHDNKVYVVQSSEDVKINNKLWSRFTLWLASHVNSDWMIPALIVTVLMLLIGLYLVISSRPSRPLPAPALISVPVASRQFAFRVINSPDAVHAGQPILVDDDVFVIGREGCNLNLAGDRQVSRRHAMIEKKEDGIYITDLNSRNGTFLEGKRLSPHQRRRLDANAEVLLGKNTHLRFV